MTSIHSTKLFPSLQIDSFGNRLELSQRTDGFGCLYGTGRGKKTDTVFRIDLVQPTRLSEPGMLTLRCAHPSRWVVIIDGEIVARCATKRRAVSAIKKLLKRL